MCVCVCVFLFKCLSNHTKYKTISIAPLRSYALIYIRTSQTSSMIAILVLSPRLGPVWKMRVYPPFRSPYRFPTSSKTASTSSSS